jgi:hypothetical protein
VLGHALYERQGPTSRVQGNSSIRSSDQISSSSLRCLFTEGKGRTYQRSVPLFEGLGTRALREDAVPYSPSSIVPENKGTTPFAFT